MEQISIFDNDIDGDLNTKLSILSYKINKKQPIDNLLIENICAKLTLYCNNHNASINEWYDEIYNNNLIDFKQQIKKYAETLVNAHKNDSCLLFAQK